MLNHIPRRGAGVNSNVNCPKLQLYFPLLFVYNSAGVSFTYLLFVNLTLYN